MRKNTWNPAKLIKKIPVAAVVTNWYSTTAMWPKMLSFKEDSFAWRWKSVEESA